jgi:hypothetical protein
MITDEQLNDIAMGTAVQVVTMAGALNKDLHAEIQKLSNIPQDLYAVNTTWFEIAYAGLFIFLRKNPNLRLPEDREKILPILKKNFIFSVVNIAFNFKDKEEVKKEIERQLETGEGYEIHMKGYSDYRGDISLLLRDQLWDAFNGDKATSKVKFIEESVLANFEKIHKERTGSILPWKKVSEDASREAMKKVLRDKGIEFALPESFLTNVSKAICEEFEEAELVNPKSDPDYKQKKKEEFKDYPHLIGNVDYTWLELFGKLYVEKGMSHINAAFLIYLKESNNTKLDMEVDMLFNSVWDLTEELLEHLEKYHDSTKYEYEIAIITYWQLIAQDAGSFIGKDLETIKKAFQSAPFTDIEKIPSWFPKKDNHSSKEFSFRDEKGNFLRESEGSKVIHERITV